MKYGDGAPHVLSRRSPNPILQLSGFTATASKKVYGFFSRGGTGGLLRIFSFDEANSTASWLPVKAAVGAYTKPGVVTGLWGSDGDKLLRRAEPRTPRRRRAFIGGLRVIQ